MAHYDLIARMNECFNELELALADLSRLLKQLDLLQARVFSLPEIAKGAEHNPADRIQVTPHVGEAAHQLALQHFQNLFIHHQGENISSKSAVRLPGVLCYAVDASEQMAALLLIEEVNKLKAELEHIVTVESGLAREQRFEFVHSHLRGLITLNAYRSISFLHDPDSVRFGWANKHIIKNVRRDEILAQLEKSLNAGRSVPPYSQEQVQHPCPMPLIALCLKAPNVHVPKLGELNDYDVGAVKHKYKPEAQPLNLLVKRLHLYTDWSVDQTSV